jgi:hypothetical protein
MTFQNRVSVHQLAAQARQECRQCRRIHETAADGIDHIHLLFPTGLNQSGHPVTGAQPQGKGIAGLVGDMADDGLDRLQPGQFLEKHLAVAHGQVLTLHQGIAQVAGEQGVLEIDPTVRSGREQDDAWILAARGGTLGHARVKGVKERRQPADLGLVV